jgi:hypothetical protein
MAHGIQFELREVVAIHKAVSEFEIRGAEASLITSILDKLIEEHEKLQKLENQVKSQIK